MSLRYWRDFTGSLTGALCSTTGGRGASAGAFQGVCSQLWWAMRLGPIDELVGPLHMVAYGYVIVYAWYIYIYTHYRVHGFGLVLLFFHTFLSCARKSSCSNSIVCCCVAVQVSLLCRCVPELCVGWRNAKQVMMTLWRSMGNRIIFNGSDKNFRTALLGTGWPKGS